jgi:hypothetical protein
MKFIGIREVSDAANQMIYSGVGSVNTSIINCSRNVRWMAVAVLENGELDRVSIDRLYIDDYLSDKYADG